VGKTCLLVTAEYPYGKGETFLESEIDYLANTFNEVFIFSLYTGDKRKTPANVKSFNLKVKLGYGKVFKFGLSGLMCNNLREKCSLKNYFAKIYSKGKAMTIFKKIKKILDGYPMNNNEIVIYSYWLNEFATAAILLKNYLSKHSYKVCVVSRAHGYDLYSERKRYNYIPFQMLNVHRLDKVYPCSEDGVSYLKKKYPDCADKIYCRRLGTKDKGVQSTSDSDGKFVIVTCSTLTSLKRVYLVAEAMKILVDRGYNVFWNCLGDGPEFSKIHDFVVRENLEKNVLFHGRKENSYVIDFYKNNYVSLFINVSTSEGVPVSIMEAMSFGIPIIATDVGGTSEIVSNDVGKLISSDLTPESLAIEIEKMYFLKEDTIKKYRNNSRSEWMKKSNASINYTNWVNELIQL